MSAAARSWWHAGDGWTPGGSIPFTDRGLRYGMSVFETIGVRDGQPLLLAPHLALLETSARNLLFPEGSVPTVANQIALLRLPELDPHDQGMLRLYITAGDGGPGDPVREPRIFALFESSSGDLPDSQTARLYPDPASPFAHGAKTGNYWLQSSAQAAARADGFDHALLYDTHGRLLSGSMANVFFVHDGALCTSSLDLAVRPGVMRAWVMEQQPVRETEFPADRLETVQEIFLTNSRLGVMPLRFGILAPGPIGCALRDRCRREKIIP